MKKLLSFLSGVMLAATINAQTTTSEAVVEVGGALTTVFRNLEYQVTVSIPNVPAEDISISSNNSNAVKITKIDAGRFLVLPKIGHTLYLSISGKTNNGDKILVTRIFPILDLPDPLLLFGGEEIHGQPMTKRNIMVSVLSGVYPSSYGLDLGIRIISFNVRIGSMSFMCAGNRLSDEVKKQISKASKGTQIGFYNIKYFLECCDWGSEVKNGSDVITID